MLCRRKGYLKMPQYQRIITEIDVPVPMRDGTVLRADVYRPDTPMPCSTILKRTPYDKALPMDIAWFDPMRAAKEGYVVVFQDVRGSMASDGEFDPVFNEFDDGYDTVEWAASQPWSNGKIGMAGLSYVGLVQLCAAKQQPPHLTCICPGMVGHDLYPNWYQGGAFLLEFLLCWAIRYQSPLLALRNLRGDELMTTMGQIIKAADAWEEQCNYLPLKGLPFLKKINLSKFYFEWLEHPNYDEYWKKMERGYLDKIQVPAFINTGWFDFLMGASLRTFTGLKEHGGSELSRKYTKLIVGPWIHQAALGSDLGQVNMGFGGGGEMIDWRGLQLRWFDYWLKGINNGVIDEPPVRLFIMGENVWRDEYEWPLKRTQYTNFYFHSAGRANSLNGDGVLSQEPPGDEEFDTYVYDPRNPVPTRGGPIIAKTNETSECGMFDQREIEARPDVLVYSTPPLDKNIEVTGPIMVKLYAVSSAPDTDFTVKLVDVWPDGGAYNLMDGIIRARYRESNTHPSLIEAGKLYMYTIDVWATSNLFKAGHRIRVEISSSNFPRFDRNHNTGHAFGGDTELRVALQKIFHDRDHPSQIVLPVIPR